jgi:para-nitrobenzyl esterase
VGATVVRTRKGFVRGSETKGIRVFRGIPFAQPPVGGLRFRAPRPVEPWTGEREATTFSAIAPQPVDPNINPIFMVPRQPQAEDCLYLNVWTPSVDAPKLPVMVWIHGGSFRAGGGSEPRYDGTALASRNVVVVTVNYRLGALGFLHVPGADGDLAANWGMLDQLAALRWVRDEIAAFGGDPGNVTIFGESAGGMSVAALMASPRASGLFRRAILQSGAGHNAVPVERATAYAEAFAAILGATPLDAGFLRSVPAQALVEAQEKLRLALLPVRGQAGAAAAALVAAIPTTPWDADMPFQPVIDGQLLGALPIDAIRLGMAKDIDALVGTTADEVKGFFLRQPPDTPPPPDRVRLRMTAWLASGTNDTAAGERLLEIYREARSARGARTELAELVDAARTDYLFRVPADRFAEAHAVWNPRTYVYRFDHPSPLLGGSYGAFHTIDIPFVFGVQRLAKAFVGEGADADALADRVGDAWVAFARSGNPTTEALPTWPAFTSTRRQTMLLARECRIEELPREQERRFWDGIIP